MAPRETPKAISKIRVSITKTNVSRPKSSPINTIKKVIATRNLSEKISVKMSNAKEAETNQKVKTVQKVMTPKSTKKENKPPNAPNTVTKSAKKALWKRRPKPAHSGVPVPEKMKKLFEQLQDSD